MAAASSIVACDEVDNMIADEELALAGALATSDGVSLTEAAATADSVSFPCWGKQTLIGRFVGDPQPLSLVRESLLRHWGESTKFEIFQGERGALIIWFESEGSMASALSDGPPPSVGGMILFLEQWREDFDFGSDIKMLYPVWLYLPELPKRFISRRAAVAIASRAGKPLLVDSASFADADPDCARIKVLCDLAATPSPSEPSGVWVELGGLRFWQRFVFGDFPKPCSVCGVLGHASLVCSSSAAAIANKGSSPKCNSEDDPDYSESDWEDDDKECNDEEYDDEEDYDEEDDDDPSQAAADAKKNPQKRSLRHGGSPPSVAEAKKAKFAIPPIAEAGGGGATKGIESKPPTYKR